MTLEELQKCPICSQHTFTASLTCEDNLVSHQPFTIKSCDQCGLLATTPRPIQAEIGRYYESQDYISHSDTQATFFDRLYLAARKLMVARKRKLISRYASGKTILDFGCGTGTFLEELAAHGWTTEGIEPSETGRQKTRDKNLSVYSSLDELPDKCYDIITLWHVLEHLHEPDQILRKLQERLTNAGVIVVAVPNPESFDATHYENQWAAYDVPRHLWHFKQGNMSKLLSQAGFDLIATKPMLLDSYYVSLLSERYKFPNQSSWQRALKAFLVATRSNLKAFSTGQYSSLIYIAKRSK